VAIPIAVAPADASPYPHHASEDRTDQSEEVFDRDSHARSSKRRPSAAHVRYDRDVKRGPDA
jgi:hypothetical protein